MNMLIGRTGQVRPALCTYGTSTVRFRGPRQRTDAGYIAALGGAETMALHLAQPYPDLLQEELGLPCLNLGVAQAGPELFLQDTAIQALVHDARAVIIDLPGAINQSNRYYRVHPRRNDRFIAPTEVLRRLYPEIDFAEIAFTGHLMARLRGAGADRFARVRVGLQITWLRRMRRLIASARGSVHLLWLSDRGPDDPAVEGMAPDFVTMDLVDRLARSVAGLTVVRTDRPSGVGYRGLPAAAHVQAAEALADPLAMALI